MSLRGRSHVKVSMDDVNENRSFIYTQLYKITSKYYVKTYYNGPDVQPVSYCLRSQRSHTGSYTCIGLFIPNLYLNFITTIHVFNYFIFCLIIIYYRYIL